MRVNGVSMTSVKTKSFEGQKPGTSGLRKKVTIFQQPHYLENFVQSIFDAVPELRGGTLVLGGDGRFQNDVAIQTIIKMAAANGVRHLIIGQNGLLSTPAASHIIRKYKADGGIILSASHNPAGPKGDFGIKYNIANGGPAPESVTDRIYAGTKTISAYDIVNCRDIDLNNVRATYIQTMNITIIDSVSDYAELMESLFDFKAISKMLSEGFTLCFDAMHAIGPYAKAILEQRLGAADGSVINGIPLTDFGGGHPEPDPTHTKELFDIMYSDDAPDFGAASDGDGDRNIILGKGIFVSPSDSLAVLAANAHLAPAYSEGISGVARSMPTSGAVDRVAEAMGIPCFVTPTGWKFFGNLLDAGKITICGEESAGTSSDHIREKDGLWAVLLWLNILAERKLSVNAILENHWLTYGRNFYIRHDFEAIESECVEAFISHLENQFPNLEGKYISGKVISRAYVFAYDDPIDRTVSNNQGWCVEFEDGDRFVIRLSGTGTVGSTLRLYLESYDEKPLNYNSSSNDALLSVLKIALELSDLKRFTGRSVDNQESNKLR